MLIMERKAPFTCAAADTLQFAEVMMNKKNTILWSLSLIIISAVTVITAVCNMAEIELPDAAVRTMGILDICAISVLVYTSVKRRYWGFFCKSSK